MRSIRFLLLVAVVSVIAGAAVPNAMALGFEDAPCLPSPQLKICKPDAEVGKSITYEINGKGGCTPDSVVYSIVAGAMPPGMSLNSSNGHVSGVPTQAGTYQFWIQVADIPQWQGGASWCQDDKQSQWQFQITVVSGLSIQQRQSNLTPAQVGTPYSFQLTTNSSSSSGLTWSVGSGALPTGINLNASTGLISGTPTQAQDSHFQVKVTNGSQSDTQTYNLSVVQPLAIATPAQTAAEVGLPVQIALSATGGKGPYTWVVTGLPAGLTFDPATGAIAGTPATPGAATVQVSVTDTLGLTKQLTVNLAVAAKLALQKQPLLPATVGVAYNVRLIRTGGVTPISWTILSGKLPAGIKFGARTGKLTGAPRRAGTYHFRVQVTDRLGGKSTLGFVLKVVKSARR
jgi:hypothetical protein